MRHFPISESELRQLGERRNAGTIFSSAGTGLIGVGIGLLRDTVFTDKPKTIALPLMAQQQFAQDFNWTPIAIAMLVGGVILLAVGIYSICAGKSLVSYIEKGTKFDGQGNSDV